jgi:hypothetical protein
MEEALNVYDILERDCVALNCTLRRRNAALPYASEDETRTRRSLNMLQRLMPAFAGLPGRKSLVYFSETLRDEPGLQYLVLGSTTPGSQGIDVTGLIQDLHREANEAGVVFYPVWASGLGGSGTGLADASLRLSGVKTILLEQSRMAGEDSALSLLTTLALDTGGVALKRSNDLGKIFPAVNEDLGCYYVLGYRNRGPGDGARHSIIVKVRKKRHEIRYRPYYMDWSEMERLDRKFRSALIAPGFHRGFEPRAEAYPLAPQGQIPLLLKIEFPLEEITLVPQSDGILYGEAEVRATLWEGPRETCKFARKISIESKRGDAIEGHRIIYETGCQVEAGEYSFSVAVLDSSTWGMGASEIPVVLEKPRPGIFSDVSLWTTTSEETLVADEASAVGIRSGGERGGFVPRATRSFDGRDEGVLYAVICPPPDGFPPGGVEVSRRILAGEQEVATFPEVRFENRSSEKAAARKGAVPSRPRGACEGIFSPIRPGQLGPGGYTMEIQVRGIGPQPLVHRAGFAVREGRGL